MDHPVVSTALLFLLPVDVVVRREADGWDVLVEVHVAPLGADEREVVVEVRPHVVVLVEVDRGDVVVSLVFVLDVWKKVIKT